MPGRAVARERPGVLVVHDTPHATAPGRYALGRCHLAREAGTPPPPLSRGAKLDAERFSHLARYDLVEVLARELLDHGAEQHVPEITIERRKAVGRRRPYTVATPRLTSGLESL